MTRDTPAAMHASHAVPNWSAFSASMRPLTVSSTAFSSFVDSIFKNLCPAPARERNAVPEAVMGYDRRNWKAAQPAAPVELVAP